MIASTCDAHKNIEDTRNRNNFTMKEQLLSTRTPTMKSSHSHFALDVPAILSGIFYGISMFAVGAVLAPLRMFLLAPLLGERNAVLVELPIILTICWYLSGQALICWYLLDLAMTYGRAYDVDDRSHVDSIGAASLLTLVLLEVTLSTTLLHRTMDETYGELTSTNGVIGLSAQLVASSFPMIRDAMIESRMI